MGPFFLIKQIHKQKKRPSSPNAPESKSSAVDKQPFKTPSTPKTSAIRFVYNAFWALVTARATVLF